MTPQFKNRLALVSIALIFTAPVMVAWLIKDDPSVLGVSDTKNYGQLFEPAVPVDLAALSTATVPEAEWVAGRWTMLHLDTDGDCDVACKDSLHAMKQVHVLLNKDAQRMQRRLLMRDDTATLADLTDQDPGLRVLTWTPDQVSTLGSLLKQPILDGMIVLLDPLGNVVLSYPKDFDPYGVQSDLRLLFKASQIG